jgi:NADH-quinone oxidoreductase subunit L
MIRVEHYAVLGAIIFAIGAIGFLTRRNVIVALMSIELMLNAVNLTLVAFNRMFLHHTGQMFTFFIIAVAAAEAAVGLAIVLAAYRVRNTIRTDHADQLKGLSRMEALFDLYPVQNFSLLGVIMGLPLLGAFVNGVFGRRLGRHGVRTMALTVMGSAFLCALVAFAMLHHHAHELHDAEGHVTQNPRLVWLAWKWLSLSQAQGIGSHTVNVSFAIDPLSATMMLVVTGVGFLIHLYSTSYMWEDPSFHRFFAYLNLFIFAMLVLILGDSLPLLFVGWEGVGLCSYLLIGFWFTEDKNATAGKKAFIANRIGDFGLLVGMAMLLYFTGALDFAGIFAGKEGLLTKVQIWPIGNGPQLFAAPIEVYASTLCALALFLGCAGKSAQIPLYVWLPDAMAGPTPVSALIHAATMVTAGLYLICRLSPVFVLSPAAMTIIACTGALTAIFAASIGLVQHDIKKVLAYSTVSQLGYMFLGVGVGAFADGFFHVFTHAFFKACLFLGAGSVIHSMHARIHDTDASQDMRNMGGLGKYMKATHATYLVSCLAIAGFPLTAGFFSKDEILAKAYENLITGPNVPGKDLWTAPEWVGKVLFAVGIIAATMTAFYMFRTYFLTFWGEFKGWKVIPGWKDPHHGHHGHDDHGHDSFEPGEGVHHLEGAEPHESPWQMTLPLAVLAFFAIAAGFLNAKIIGETAHLHALTWLDHWLEPVFRTANVYVQTPEFNAGHAWGLAVPGILAAFTGIGGAYYVYVMQKGEPTRALAAAIPGFHQLLLDKWRVDELYELTVIGAVDELATTATVADKWIIDGTLAKLTALIVAGLGQLLRLVQTGKIQVYGAVMVAGMLGLMGFLYLPHPDAIVAGDEASGAYTVQAAGGVGYKFRWDADGDGKPDSQDFGDVDRVELKLDRKATKLVVLEVQNAFGRKAKKVFAVTRPAADGQAAFVEDLEKIKELNDQIQQLQKAMTE